ncbi:hypothetical protein HID58_068871, partial [Brassica napus]
KRQEHSRKKLKETADTKTTSMNNLALMNDFARGSGNDKQLINAYERCANSCGIATKELEGAKELLRNSSFQ